MFPFSVCYWRTLQAKGIAFTKSFSKFKQQFKAVGWVWGQDENIVENRARKLEIKKEEPRYFVKVYHSGSSIKNELKRFFFFFPVMTVLPS